MITSFKRVYFRHRALAAVKAAGGKFGFREYWREGLVSRARGLPRSFVDRALANANLFIFPKSGATDDALAQVAKFPLLEFLSISNSPVTDQGLLFLKDLRRLRMLDAIEELIIYDTVITEDGDKEIGHLPNLRVMCLTATNVTDSLFEVLKNMPQLKDLFFDEALCNSLTNDERTSIPCIIHSIPEDQT